MKKSIIIFGDDPAGPTGFGKVTAHLAEAATKTGARTAVVALRPNPDQAWTRTRRYCAPTDTDPDGRQTAEEAMTAEDADMVVSVGDPWQLQGLVDLRQRRTFTWIGCTPVDSTPYPRYILLAQSPQQYLDTAFLMRHMDRIVTFSRFGQRAVEKMLAGAFAAPGAGGAAPPVEAVYLGVDSHQYRPGPRQAARQVFKGAVDEKTLLFTCIKVNSMRAGFDTLLSAWAKALGRMEKADPDLARRSKLYLHTNVAGSGYPVPLLMQRYGIENSLLLNPDLAPGQGVPESVMVQIHQATDIAVSAARAEGFGLPVLEAMACGIACIVPDYGAPSEYGGRGVLRVPIAATYNPEFATTDFAIADEDAMAEQLLALALNPAHRAAVGDRGRAVAKALTWKRFEEQWAEIIGTVMSYQIHERPKKNIQYRISKS